MGPLERRTAVLHCEIRLHPRRVPGQIVVNNAVTKLVVESLTANLGKQKDVKSLFVVTRQLKSGSGSNTLLIGSTTMNQADP